MAYFQRRRELLKDSLTATQVANLLGLPAKLLTITLLPSHQRNRHIKPRNSGAGRSPAPLFLNWEGSKSQNLIGILDNGSYRFPIWQFDPGGADGVVNGLPVVLKGLQVSDFAKLNWLTRPNPVLEGLTPIVALKQG